MNLMCHCWSGPLDQAIEKELGLTHGEFVALGRIDRKEPAGAVWIDTAGHSNVSIYKRR